MNKKRMMGVLLAGVLAVSLLPVAALADSDSTNNVYQLITNEWDSDMLLYMGENGQSGFFLLPSEFDEANYRLVSGENTAGGTVRMDYDSQGNLTTAAFKDDSTGSTLTWQYDSQGRVVRSTDRFVGYDEDGTEDPIWDTAKEFTYDSQGRKTAEAVTSDDYSYVLHYTYDSQGRLIEERNENDGAPGVTVYTYEGDDLVKEVFEGDGVRQETAYAYDNGLLKQENIVISYAEEGGYRVSSRMDFYFAYDGDGRLVNRKSDLFGADGVREYGDEYQWTFFLDGKLNKQEYVYEYLSDEGVPNLTSRDCTISYDSAGRVSRVETSGMTYTYSYDQAGNNTKIAVYNRLEGESAYDLLFTYEPIGGSPEPQPVTAFTDVPSDAYYADAVAWAVEKGVTTGTGDGKFSPGATCTRAQVVTFLWRAMGEPEAMNGADLFTDVDPNAYYFDAVLWALDNGVTIGAGDGKFYPNDPCNRGQVVTFLWRALGKPAVKGDVQQFLDVSAGSYCAQAVQWALDKGVTTGTGNGRFSPNATCTRAQVVTFLYRALGQTK